MPDTKSFHDRLLAFQTSVGAVAKSKDNPFFKSKYADINAFLAVIKPVLSENGLILKQPIENTENGLIMRTIVTDGTDQIESVMPIPQTQDIQKLGQAITYIRRYSLQSLLSLEAEDDDGNSNKEINQVTEKHLADIDACENVNALKKLYEKNKGLGKEYAQAVTAKKKQLVEAVPVTNQV